MKKLFTLLMTLTATLVVFAGGPDGSIMIDDSGVYFTLTYETDTEGNDTNVGSTATVSWCVGWGEASTSNQYPDLANPVVIPEEIFYNDTYFTVTNVGSDAFYKCSTLVTLELPKTIKQIGYETFCSCSNLKDLYLRSEALESIDCNSNAFNSSGSGKTLYGPTGYASSYTSSSMWSSYSSHFSSDIKEYNYSDFYTEGIYYNLVGGDDTDDDDYKTEVEVTAGVKTYTGERTIPATVSYHGITRTVTSIASNAFAESTSALTLTIEKEDEVIDFDFQNAEFPDDFKGTLKVPAGLERAYYEAGWGECFTINNYIEGTEIADEESGLTYEITDQYENKVTIAGFTCAESVTIPVSITYDDVVYTITAVDGDVFNCEKLKEVTMEATVPPFDASVFKNIAKDAVLYVTGNEETYAEAGWTEYFMISGYVAVGEEFEVNNIKYKVLDGKEAVEIIGATEGEITIVESVTYNGLEFTVKSITADAFANIDDLTVTTEITDPTLISFETYSGDLFGTLEVPDGSLWDFYYSDWAKYFTIDGIIGTQFSVDNLTYEITDQYNNEVKIASFTCSESVTIPETVLYSVNKETYTVTAVDENVFACEELKEVTMSASTPPFEVSAFTGIPEGVVLKVGNNQENYKDWHGTFIIYGYVEAGDTFSDDVFTYTVLSDTKTVQITALQSTAGTTFGIPTSVIYNGLDFTVKSIADGVFTGKSELKVGVTFTDPSTISLGTIASGNVGTLSVPEGSERNFENSSWSTYFTIANFIEGTQFTENGITYEITDQYSYQVKIVGFTCSSSVVIPESAVGYTITAVADDVFNCSDLISVTMEANTPPFSGSTFSNIGENAVLYVDNISAYTTLTDNWHNYFTIYGYVEAGDTFSDDVFSYKVLSGAETVEITGIVTTGLSFTINTEVEYNGLTLGIASVDGSIFIGKSDLDVIANFKDPEVPKIDNYNGSQVGTLEVPDGYLYIFTETNWEKYFVIEGTYLLKDGVQYYFQKDGTADVVGIDTSEKIILTDRVDGFAIETIEESVFEDYLNLEVEITVVNPFSIALDEREDTSIKYGVLTVPDGCNSMYASTVWEDYFVLEGDPYYTDGSGVYYIFHIEVVEVDEEGIEVVSLNKALKATTTEYRITLEVAYVDPEVTEITVPRTIDLGDDSSSNTSYEITSMNADALKDCKDLVTINLEATIPAEDINALNYVPDAVTIVLDEEELGTEYCESVMAAAEKVGISVKMATTGIVEVKIASDKVEIERYNLLGQRISAPQRGINIIKYSDGTVEKVLIK